jgi:hypothetical protein
MGERKQEKQREAGRKTRLNIIVDEAASMQIMLQ